MSYIDAIDKVEVPRPPKYYTPPRFETVSGLPIAYRREGSGEAVVLLHGAGFTRMWIPLYQMLAAGCDFIAPEQPGFGETPMPKWFRNFDEGIHLYSEFSAAARLMWAPRYNLALERRLQRLTCPTLVVGGEVDRLVPNEMSDRYAEVLPNSRLVRIPGTGHEPCLERPRELADTLLGFIAETK